MGRTCVLCEERWQNGLFFFFPSSSSSIHQIYLCQASAYPQALLLLICSGIKIDRNWGHQSKRLFFLVAGQCFIVVEGRRSTHILGHILWHKVCVENLDVKPQTCTSVCAHIHWVLRLLQNVCVKCRSELWGSFGLGRTERLRHLCGSEEDSTGVSPYILGQNNRLVQQRQNRLFLGGTNAGYGDSSG